MVTLDNLNTNLLYSENNTKMHKLEVRARYENAKEVYYKSEPFRIDWLSDNDSLCNLVKLGKCVLEGNKPIKSTGGSSSYYDLELPAWVVEKILNRKAEDGKYYIKTEECCEVFFGNDFDYSNLFKSSVRSYGTEQGGGKSGNSVEYEQNKIIYSANKIKELSGRRNKE